jgi:thiamine biosynthesis lipoprotein ApbE
MQIDLCSVVKGYVGDEADRLLKEQGITPPY